MTTKHACELAALLMNASHWLQSNPDMRAAYLERTGEPHGTVSPYRAASDALALIRIGKGVSRRAVALCNGIPRWNAKAGMVLNEWTEADDARREKADGKALKAAQAIADRYALRVKLGGDPRGFVLKLLSPDDRYNTLGGSGDGWGVA
jgi:hypothetical protein